MRWSLRIENVDGAFGIAKLLAGISTKDFNLQFPVDDLQLLDSKIKTLHTYAVGPWKTM